jgi:nitroimidazol reductase NimA-like FMN-containing flavoprotein (pyridoxamine 5'-phosphate oxidase superfamily)
MKIDRDGLEVLNRTECFRLLDSAGLGRIAVSSGALPLVLPVGYVMDGDTIVVDVGHGPTLEFATTGAVVGFEVDNLHENGHTGWTVMVTGVADGVRDELEIARLRQLFPAGGEDGEGRLMRISCELISGRRTHRRHRHTRSRAAARLAERP